MSRFQIVEESVPDASSFRHCLKSGHLVQFLNGPLSDVTRVAQNVLNKLKSCFLKGWVSAIVPTQPLENGNIQNLNFKTSVFYVSAF